MDPGKPDRPGRSDVLIAARVIPVIARAIRSKVDKVGKAGMVIVHCVPGAP